MSSLAAATHCCISSLDNIVSAAPFIYTSTGQHTAASVTVQCDYELTVKHASDKPGYQQVPEHMKDEPDFHSHTQIHQPLNVKHVKDKLDFHRL